MQGITAIGNAEGTGGAGLFNIRSTGDSLAKGINTKNNKPQLVKNSPYNSPRLQHRTRPTTKDDYADMDDPLIAYFGFSYEEDRKISPNNKNPKLGNKNTSTTKRGHLSSNVDVEDSLIPPSAPSANIVYEVNSNDKNSQQSTGGVCRRRYQSYADKLTASSNNRSEYDELLRVKQLKNTHHGAKLGFSSPSYTSTATDSLSDVLNAFDCDSSLMFENADASGLLTMMFSADSEAIDSINQFIEREAQMYREAKLYQDIEAELIETVGVIERIGRTNRDWRHSVIQINEADRINMVNTCALELDALNRTASSSSSSQQPKTHSLKVRNSPNELIFLFTLLRMLFSIFIFIL